MNEMTGQQGMNGENGQSKPQPVQVKTVDNSSAATMALAVSYTHLDVYKRQFST